MIVLAEADKVPKREALKLAPKYEAHVRYKIRCAVSFFLPIGDQRGPGQEDFLWHAMLVSRGVRHRPKERAPGQSLARAFLRAWWIQPCRL